MAHQIIGRVQLRPPRSPHRHFPRVFLPRKPAPFDRTRRRFHGSCCHLHLSPLDHEVDTHQRGVSSLARRNSTWPVVSPVSGEFAAFERHRRGTRAKRNRRCDERRTRPRITPRTCRYTWWEECVPVGGRRREETSAWWEERYERATVG